MNKLVCMNCGFIARASTGAVNTYGLPEHCNQEMMID